MSLPGFTAEASLDRNDARYRTAAPSAAPRGAAGVVTPQLTTCRDVYRRNGVIVRCCWWNDGTQTCWFDHEGYPGRVV
jgi:hypothetical protein